MKSSLIRRVGCLLLLGVFGGGSCRPIDPVPYNGAVDYAGYPATDPSKAWPPRPAAPVFPLGFQPTGTGRPSLQINTNVAPPAPVIPPFPKGWPNNMSPSPSSGSSTWVSPLTPGGRPQPRRQQTVSDINNRPPTPFARPPPKRQATLPVSPGHWHPSMGMGPRPVTPVEPFIPPGFSGEKAAPNAPHMKAPPPKKKKISGYDADNEKGRVRKTKGLAAPGYGSDSNSPSTPVARKPVPRKVQGMQSTPRGPRKDSASPTPAVTGNRGARSPPTARKGGVSKGTNRHSVKKAPGGGSRSKDGARPKAAAGPKRRK